ncbi:zinc finger SWIM domain-containing protein 7 isoform X1 [Alosa sapidissima]|uniref:zinc finger SWIM domain-containing protein 7 isoform X1 n=1 Tax=Alosa sapidissima TaxID=34773 RepID=UPI001C0925B3|nr:zinc finger SWIM domain-containing protein 7 isoform X1 [Alosa sapidissima]
MSSPIFPFVAEQLLKDIEKSYKERAQLPDDLLIALRYVFGSCALQALDLVDQRSVTCVSSPSGRRVFRVMGGSGQRYTCFTSCHYCPCPAFSILVLKRNTSLLAVCSPHGQIVVVCPRAHHSSSEAKEAATAQWWCSDACRHYVSTFWLPTCARLWGCPNMSKCPTRTCHEYWQVKRTLTHR